jgi:spermidine synthase
MHAHEQHSIAICGMPVSIQTKFQQMAIVDSLRFGRCLILDGKVQSSESDEYIYHEALVHPGMIAHPAPRNIMVVGGGEGATIREILKHPGVEHVVMVDIDEEVVDSCKKYLPTWHMGAFDDPRVEVLCFDARKYLEETSNRFDVIIIDITEPLEGGPAYLLFTKEFYQTVYQRLTNDGVLIVQSGSAANNDLLCFSSIYKTLRTVFPTVRACHTFIPSIALLWGFTVSFVNKNRDVLSGNELYAKLEERGLVSLKYYDQETHLSMFSLHKYLRESFEKDGKLIQDDVPLTY